jgi:hypothetical protein
MGERARKIKQAIAAHDDALAYARERVRKVCGEGIEWCGLKLKWFEQEETLKAWRVVLMILAFREARMMHDLVRYARAGWGLADDALCELDLVYGHVRVARPAPLEVYLTDRRLYGRPLRVQSSQPHSHFLRDLVIACVVAELCVRFGLSPRRSSTTMHPSGCSVAKDALLIEHAATVDESTVNAAWSRFGRFTFKGMSLDTVPLIADAILQSNAAPVAAGSSC